MYINRLFKHLNTTATSDINLLWSLGEPGESQSIAGINKSYEM